MTCVDPYRERLRGAGLRATLPRIAVLRHLTEAMTPLSHAEVADGLADATFDRTTIYRNLVDLADAGLLQRTDLGDHVWRFATATPGRSHGESSHPHFICSSCGAVECLPEDAVRLRASRRTPRALRQRGLEIQIRGRCDGCR